MPTLFISDLHLCEHRPELTAAFIAFLEQQASRAQALYILGDLFEFWIGDDEQTALQQQVAAALRALRQRGVEIRFIHGNRDFLLGAHYAREAGMTLLPAQLRLRLGEQQILLMHGDELCTLDLGYQRFRRITGWSWLRHLFLALPLSWRQRIARKMRQQSRGRQIQADAPWLDVTPAAVEQTLHQHQARVLIHGHTHKPAHHTLTVDGQPCSRWVLGDWEREYTYLQIDQQGVIQLIRCPVPPLA